MQNALPSTFAHPASTTATTAKPAPSFVATLQSTVRVFEHHPLTILACAVLLFASAGLIGSLLYGALIGEVVLRTGSHSGAVVGIYNMQMLVQAVVGTCTYFLGRGAMTWIALHADDGTPINLRTALHETLRRWQPLLASTVFYGVLITLGTIGLTVLLRELRLDVSNARWLRGDIDSVLNWTTVRAIGLLPPDAGPPFSEWLSTTKYNLARTSSASYYGFDYFSRYDPDSASRSTWIAGFIWMALLVLCEVMLCMRTVAVFASNSTSAMSWLAWSLRMGGRHFGRVLVWRWLLRLATALLIVTTLILLPALHQVVVMGNVRQALGTGFWPYHIAQSAYGIASAFVGGLLVAFGVAFEARMYATLSQSQSQH